MLTHHNRFLLVFVFLLLSLLSGCDNKKHEILEVYIDRATLPTIQQMINIVDRMSPNKKLIYWSRYPIKDSDTLNLINANSFQNIEDLKHFLISSLIKKRIKKVIIHGNTLWAIDVIDILNAIDSLGNNIPVEINFYDDGSAEYKSLYEFSKLTKKEQIHKIHASKNNIEASIKRKCQFYGSIENIYGFSQIYPTTYHMLRLDIFNSGLNLKALRDTLLKNAVQMQWGYFNHFNQKQKELFYTLTEFNPEKIKEQYKKNPSENFMFIGTNSGTATAEQQIKIITEAKKKNSAIIKKTIDGYDLFFKGHPSADYNKQIIDAHNMIEINNKVPFEVLIMTGALPDAVGGMGSSVFFSLPKTVKNKFVFYNTDVKIESDPLIQVMVKLGVVDKSDIKLIGDL